MEYQVNALAFSVSTQGFEVWAGQIYYNITKSVVYVRSGRIMVGFSCVPLRDRGRQSAPGAIFRNGSVERLKLLQKYERKEILRLTTIGSQARIESLLFLT